ncbi:PadR family transcriptional regulator [Paenibacillus sp. FSL K6-1230]|uniref:PadR family transcriptional regulator n=1 Tax=Paenibacillus sp. FSL K6-1230 TaxID=2921603 RepID=UPI0030F911A3
MSLRIYILGSLYYRELHPYEIKKKIMEATDNKMNITDGNLYYNFEALLKKDYIRKSETVQSENRPEKTTYRITEAGQEALKEGIYAAFKNPKSIESLFAPMLFIELVDIQRLIFFIQEIITELEKDIEQYDDKSVNYSKRVHEAIQTEKGQYARFIVDHVWNRKKLELDSFTKLLNILKNS